MKIPSYDEYLSYTLAKQQENMVFEFMEDLGIYWTADENEIVKYSIKYDIYWKQGICITPLEHTAELWVGGMIYDKIGISF